MPSFDSGSSTGTHRSSPYQTSIVGPREIEHPPAPRRPARRCSRPRARSTQAPRRRPGRRTRRERRRPPGALRARGHDTEMERDTVAVYEARAEEWRDRRRPRFLDQVRALAAATPPGAVSVDLGCGAGLHLAELRRPVVALDAAHAMVRLAREAAPDAWPVQADLEALPFRAPGARRGLGAGQLPPHPERAAAGCPRRPPPGAGRRRAGPPPAARGHTSGVLADDDFPGRWFSAWTVDDLADVLRGRGVHGRLVRDRRRRRVLARGPGHARPDAARHRRARHAPARVRPEPVGVLGRRRHRLRPARATASGPRRWRPGIVTATATRATRSSRHGVGMTDLVKRATPRADELTRDEYRAGLARVERHGARGCSRARCASSAWPAGAPRSTGRPSPACSPTASAVGPPT